MLVRRRRAISLCKQMGSVAGRAHMNPIEQIAVGCGVAKRTARGFICRCPAHEDRMPSLSIGYGHHGNILVHCFAGCDGNSVISALRERGLWPWQPRIDRPSLPGSTKEIVRVEDNRSLVALRIWNSTQSAKNSLVQSYLARRSITVSIPPSLRAHLGLRHPSGSRWPAMVALVTSALDDKPIAIHRTWAALSTSGLRSLTLPDDERDIIVLADADEAGEAACPPAEGNGFQ